MKKEQNDESLAPEIRIGNIRYHAIPLDRELDPFLKAISNRDACSKQLPSSIQEQINQIEIPALLKVYITPQCPCFGDTIGLLFSAAL